MEDMEFVAVRTCRSHEEASIIQHALENEGLRCALENDHQGGFTGVLAIRILVPKDQVPQAEAFLNEHHSE